METLIFQCSDNVVLYSTSSHPYRQPLRLRLWFNVLCCKGQPLYQISVHCSDGSFRIHAEKLNYLLKKMYLKYLLDEWGFLIYISKACSRTVSCPIYTLNWQCTLAILGIVFKLGLFDSLKWFPFVCVCMYLIASVTEFLNIPFFCEMPLRVHGPFFSQNLLRFVV